MTLFSRGRPVREPFPDHIILGGTGFPCGYSERGGTQLLAEVPPDKAQIVPSQFNDQAFNSVFGVPYAYRNFRGGFGQKRLRGEFTGRVWYCLASRTRTGILINGPALTSYTPATRDTTNGINRFFEIGGKVYALGGRYALDGGTTGTGWSVSKDFGASDHGYDAVVVQQNGTGTTRYALVGLGDSTAGQKFDGTTWTAWTSMNARALVVAEEEIWLADSTNRLRNCSLDADFTVAANWASPTARIGSGDHAINRLGLTPSGGLLICKADDLYTVDGKGDQHRLFGERQFPPSSYNGEPFGRWKQNLYVTYGGGGHLLVDGGDALDQEQVGIEMLRDNGSPVKGYMSAWCGTDYFLLAGVYDPDSGDSWLMEHTGEFTTNEQGLKEPVWHGSIIATQSDKKIQAIHQSTLGAASGHKMAYLGFSDSTISKYPLACSPDPADCAQEAFVTTGYCYLPRTYFFFAGHSKALHRAVGEGDNLSSTNYATLSYRTSATAAYGSIAAFDSGQSTSVDFPDSSSCVFLDPLLTLTGADATVTPQISGLVIEQELRTPPKQVFTVNILAEDNLRKRDGTPYRMGADDIRDRVYSLAGLPSSVELVDPDEETRQVTVRAPVRTIAYDDLRKAHAAIQVQLAEVRRVASGGAYDDLSAYTYGAMSAYTYGQLEALG